MKNFKSSEVYYRSVFQELIHATGAQKRLHRKSLIDSVPFGTESYAMETLIAQMGSALLCCISGIHPYKTSLNLAAINTWKEVLRADPSFITKAAGHAQRRVGRADEKSCRHDEHGRHAQRRCLRCVASVATLKPEVTERIPQTFVSTPDQDYALRLRRYRSGFARKSRVSRTCSVCSHSMCATGDSSNE